jgi:predicted ribosome quality control (RQC) complex YloA/Tae2 family protein
MVSGRDLQQSDLLVSKYLRHGDIYVHSDVVDASMCVIRAKDKEGVTSSISPIAIQEAGIMVICRSSVWKSKNNGAAPW